MRSIKLDNSVLSILKYRHWQIRINTIIYNIRYKGNDKIRINKFIVVNLLKSFFCISKKIIQTILS